jgi:hypothetical protein
MKKAIIRKGLKEYIEKWPYLHMSSMYVQEKELAEENFPNEKKDFTQEKNYRNERTLQIR